MTVVPWTLGVKYYPFCNYQCFSPYLGIGAGLAYIHYKDDSFYVRRNTDLFGGALLVKSGVEMALKNCYFLDAFCDYSWHKFERNSHKKHTKVHNPQTGGIKVGLGIGKKL